MLFTKEQRQKLNEFSKLLYGSESRWQKELAAGNFRIPTGTVEVKEQVETIQNRNKDGRLGTVLKRSTAIRRALRSGGQAALDKFNEAVPSERTRQVQQFREPSYDDLVSAFEQMIDSQKISKMPKEEMIQVLAYRYVKGVIQFPVSLVKRDVEGYDRNVDEILKTVPEARRQEIQDLIVTEEIPATGIPLDAFQFVSDFVFALNHETQALALATDSLNAVDISQQKSKVPYFFSQTLTMTEGRKFSPSQKAAIEHNRAKAKAARKARRKQRSA